MRMFLIILLTVYPVILASAQRSADTWYFGNAAALLFSKGDPVAVNESKLNIKGRYHSPAILSDPVTGDLVFYTDGEIIWNHEHEVMANGFDIRGSETTQTALIVPHVGEEGVYYLFTLFRPNSSVLTCELYYSVIDMNLDGGKGDVTTTKNILLQSNLVGKLAAVPHVNGSDFWLIVHEFGTNAFLTALISETGLSSFFRQEIGEVHLTEEQTYDVSTGYMKVSPNGRLLAITIAAQVDEPLNLFDFDSATGVISNYRSLECPGTPFGLSFSPNNSLLYVSVRLPLSSDPNEQINAVIQYDVSLGDVNSVNSSAINLIPTNPFTNVTPGVTRGGPANFALQLGSDGRIYSGDNWLVPIPAPPQHLLLVIDQPNKKGFDCMINLKSYNFQGGEAGALLPNFIESVFNGIESRTICSLPSSIQTYPNPTPQIINIKMHEGCETVMNIRIFNTIGQEVGSLYNTQSEVKIDMSHLPSGLYFFEIGTKYNTRITKKIVRY